MNISIIIPARNESSSLASLLPKILDLGIAEEIIVVDDGSTDSTMQTAKSLNVKVIQHPYRMGNGAAIKTGARHASGSILVTMDADGQHEPEDIPALLSEFNTGYSMVVGSRVSNTQASLGRRIANGIYNRFASLIVGHTIRDLTSGFRVVNTRKFREFLNLLPNGFSYPTTITMAFFRAGYSVKYVAIRAQKRVGKSHIKPLRDGMRFIAIIFKVGTLYSPLKIFAPFAALFFLLGNTYYAYTYMTAGRFTNMSALMLIVAVVIFLIGLVSEQITNLLYSSNVHENEPRA